MATKTYFDRFPIAPSQHATFACRLRWDTPEGGYFEELQGPEASILPNGLAWDQQQFFHADTGHRTITEYPTDRDGLPLPSPSGESIRGRVVLTVPESDGVIFFLSQPN